MLGSGVTLTLTNITLAKIPIIVSAGGKLVLETGAVIKENSGTGVTVNGGALEMKTGALVTKNTASVSGGGVRLNGGTFTMSGGEISENTSDVGGGVRMDGGAFTMSGGEISENTSAAHGGGVYASGAFTMTGGKISGNKAGPGGWDGTGDGGGVLLTGENTVFALSGSGEISGNTAGGYGGGVRIAFGEGEEVLNQIFHMSGGIIKNNHAEQYGGGLCGGDFSSVFNMTGGEITGNTINYGSGGSGVYIYWTQVTGNPRIGAKANYVGSVYDNPGGDWQ
jgi:predicted outer membrane repeat protein